MHLAGVFPLLFLLGFGPVCSCAQDSISIWTRQDVVNSIERQYPGIDHNTWCRFTEVNNDTILAIGYVENRTNRHWIPHLFKTLNGGENWSSEEFSEHNTAMIYDLDNDANGRVWMVASNNRIYYSPDLGVSWVAINSPFDVASKITTISMRDSLHGVAGGMHNTLAITDDNWSTYRVLPTPYDQGIFSIDNPKKPYGLMINQVACADTVILINQTGHICVSYLGEIEWEQFNLPVKSFQFHRSTEKWYLEGIRNRYFVLSESLALVREFEKQEARTPVRRPTGKLTQEHIDSFLVYPVGTILVDSRTYDRIGWGPWATSSAYEGDFNTYVITPARAKELQLDNGTKIFHQDTLKDLLTSFHLNQDEVFRKYPLRFDDEDYANFETLLSSERRRFRDRKFRGYDKSSDINLAHHYFTNYKKTLEHLDSSFVHRVMKSIRVQEGSPRYFDSLQCTLINTNNDSMQLTLLIGDVGYYHGKLPCWQLTSQGDTAYTCDPHVIAYVRSLLIRDLRERHYLPLGEFIYALITEKIIEEQTYENPFSNE